MEDEQKQEQQAALQKAWAKVVRRIEVLTGELENAGMAGWPGGGTEAVGSMADRLHDSAQGLQALCLMVEAHRSGIPVVPAVIAQEGNRGER